MVLSVIKCLRQVAESVRNADEPGLVIVKIILLVARRINCAWFANPTT